MTRNERMLQNMLVSDSKAGITGFAGGELIFNQLKPLFLWMFFLFSQARELQLNDLMFFRFENR